MAMGLPVITNAGVGDVEQIVNIYKGGYVLNEFTQQSFHSIAQKINDGAAFNAEDIRQGAIEFYSLDKAVKKYIRIYEAILK